MPYNVYETRQSNWYLVTRDDSGLAAANEVVDPRFKPFKLHRVIDSLKVIGLAPEEEVKANLDANGFHMQSVQLNFREQ